MPLSLTVQGWPTYLVLAQASMANSDTGQARDGYIRISADSGLVGTPSRTSLDKYSGGSYYYQSVSLSFLFQPMDTNSHTIELMGVISNAGSNGLLANASLTIIAIP